MFAQPLVALVRDLHREFARPPLSRQLVRTGHPSLNFGVGTREPDGSDERLRDSNQRRALCIGLAAQSQTKSAIRFTPHPFAARPKYSLATEGRGD